MLLFRQIGSSSLKWHSSSLREPTLFLTSAPEGVCACLSRMARVDIDSSGQA